MIKFNNPINISPQVETLSNNEFNTLKEIMENELIPFNLLTKFLKKKWSLCQNIKEKDDFINDYQINSQINIEYLNQMIENKESEEKIFNVFKKLKFSLKESDLKEVSKKIKNINKDELSFIKISPKKRFEELYTYFNNLVDDDSISVSIKIKSIKSKINSLKEIYKMDNGNSKYPIIMGSIEYQYNKLFSDVIDIFYNFTYQKYSIFLVDDQTKKEQKNIEKRKRSITDENESYESFKKGFSFYSKFIKIFNNLDNNDEINIKKLKIIVFYFSSYENERKINANKYSLLRSVITCMKRKSISYDKILQYNKLIAKDKWDNLNENEEIEIKINNEKYNIKIKKYNESIFDLEPKDIELLIDSPKIEELSFEYLLKYNYLQFNTNIENKVKEFLFQLLNSKTTKEGLSYNDNRFKYDKLKYIFEGRYSNEIFNEIYNNIIIIPFPFNISSGMTFRFDYTIFINIYPRIDFDLDFSKVIPIYHSKINDLYHEYNHIIGINYSVAYNITLTLTPTLEKRKIQELKQIQREYIKKYYKTFNPNDKIKLNDFDDLGDLQELYFYGIKPYIFRFYSSLFFININSLNLNKKDFKDKCSTYFNSNLKFNLNEILKEEKIIIKSIDFNIEIDENKIPKSDEKKKKKSQIEIKKSKSEKKCKRNNKIKEKKEEILKAIQLNINSDLSQEIIKIFPLKSHIIENCEFREVRNRKFMGQNDNLISNTEFRVDRFSGHRRPYPW